MAAKSETSVRDWELCVAAGICRSISNHRGLDHPITDVSWHEVSEYIRWVAGGTQLPLRVPTKKEWLEIAADHAPVPRKPLFTDPRMAWAANYDITAKPQSRVTEVIGSFGENRYGLRDLRGNVWEWVDDCYYGQPEARMPDGRCIGGRLL
ncbi:hypothetical protein AB833_03645 [Chromatiales bacterium (ex Bugula neritina AB1)]|nr:hypothetical protein AB833_03645 [Chromatiales bacterium (ex Bugula neritina AB1)]